PNGGERTAEQVGALIGGDDSVYFANSEGGRWITLDGEALDPPAPWPFSGPVRYAPGGEEEHFAHAAPVAGTPFSMVAAVPLTTVLARPALFLRRGGLTVALLLLAGAAAA